jgi:hypothetical protein
VSAADGSSSSAAELRYAFFANTRVSPYAVAGTGRGVERGRLALLNEGRV